MYGSHYFQPHPPSSSFDIKYYAHGPSHALQGFPSSSSDLPDLYYGYELATPPSASSSEAICTPPLGAQPSLYPWGQPATVTAAVPPESATASAQALSFQSSNNSGIPLHLLRSNPSSANFDPPFRQFSGLDQTPRRVMGRDDAEEPQLQKPELYSQGLSLATGFISPAATLLNPAKSISPSATSQTPLKLHQPRPSRRIPIVNLDQLATACDTSSQEETPKPENSVFCSQIAIQSHARSLSDQGHIYPISGVCYPNQVHSKSGDNPGMQRSLLCLCGCMESYTF